MSTVISLPNIDLPCPEAWERGALCAAEGDPASFYPDGGGWTAFTAKAVCARCPVRAQCLDFALRHMDSVEGAGYWGIWAGTSERERRRLRLKHGGDAAKAVAEVMASGRSARHERLVSAEALLAQGAKRCATCRAVKNLDDFRRSSRSRDGRTYDCKACRSAADRKRAGKLEAAA